MNQIDLRGQVAVVTGGSSGVGHAIARRLAASGATVTIWDTRPPSPAPTAGERLSFERVDVRDSASIAAGAAHLTEVHVLVTSAGIAGLTASVADYPEEEWERVVDVNLHGVFRCCRAIVPLMQNAAYGRIVNVASVVGKDPNPREAAYAASKAGVIALTTSLGRELATTGVIVNCVTPALIDTPMIRELPADHLQYCLDKIPMGRVGTGDEVASMVAWLSSPECSFTTGAAFDLSGGRSSY